MNIQTNLTRRADQAGADDTLPNDPRDCCRAARKVMDDDFHDAEELVRDTFAALPDLFPDNLRGVEHVRSCLSRAETAMDTISARLDKIGALVRHGTTDLRAIDAMLAVRAKAIDEGRDPDEATRKFEAQQQEDRT